MKKNTIVFFTALLMIAFSFQINAQNTIGVRIGSHWANVNATDGLDNLTSNFESIRSTELAVFTEIPIMGGFSFQPEIAYTTKGFSLDTGVDLELFNVDLPVGAYAESRFNYIEMPLLGKYAFGDGPFKAYVTAGPSFGYATKGTLESRVNVLLDLKVGETNIDLEGNNFERFEIGAALGAGVEFETSFGKLFADARYKHGFTQVYDIPITEETVSNKGFALSVGFAVPMN